MNKEVVNSWLQLTANVGVIAGIIFLAVEINQNSVELNQNTAVATAQAVWQLNQGMDSAYRTMAQDPTLTKLVNSGYENPDSLTELEREQFGYWMRATFNSLEAAWFYYDKGLIREEDFGGYKSALCNRINTNGGAQYWEDNAEYFADGFISDIEDWCFR